MAFILPFGPQLKKSLPQTLDLLFVSLSHTDLSHKILLVLFVRIITCVNQVTHLIISLFSLLYKLHGAPCMPVYGTVTSKPRLPNTNVIVTIISSGGYNTDRD